MKIGETILKLREEKKMSQEEFAQYYHVTRQTISNWEKEKNYPDLQTLVKISDESGVPLDSMLKDNFSMVQEIDKKVRHLKIFKIGTIVVLAIVILVSAYIGIQNGKQISWRNLDLSKKVIIIASQIPILSMIFICLTDLLYGNGIRK